MMKYRMIFKNVIIMITLSTCIAQLPPSSSSQMKCECTCTQIGNPKHKYTAVGNFDGKINPVVPSQQPEVVAKTEVKMTSGGVTDQPATTKQTPPAGTGPTEKPLEPNVEFIGGFNMLEVLMKKKKIGGKQQEQQQQPNNGTAKIVIIDTTTEAPTTKGTTPEMTMITTIPTAAPTEPVSAQPPRVIRMKSQQPPPKPVKFKLNGNGGQMSSKSVFSLNGKVPKPAPPRYNIKNEIESTNETGSGSLGIISGGVFNGTNSVISGVSRPPEPKPVVRRPAVSDYQSSSLGGGGGGGVLSGGVLSGVIRSEFKDGFRQNGGVIVETITKRQENQQPGVNFSVVKSAQLSPSGTITNKQHITQPKLTGQVQNQFSQQSVRNNNNNINNVNNNINNQMQTLMQQNMMLEKMQQFQQEPLEPELPSNWQVMPNTGPQMMQNPNAQMMPQSGSQMIQPSPPRSNQQNMDPPNMQNGGNKNRQNFGTTEAPWAGTTQQSAGNWNVGTQQPQRNAQNWNQQGGNSIAPSTVSPPPTKSSWNVQQPKSQSNPGGQWSGGSNQSMPPQGNNVGQNNQNMQNMAGNMPPSATMSMMEQFGGGMEMANPFNMGNMGMFPMGEMPGPNPFFFGAR